MISIERAVALATANCSPAPPIDIMRVAIQEYQRAYNAWSESIHRDFAHRKVCMSNLQRASHGVRAATNLQLALEAEQHG